MTHEGSNQVLLQRHKKGINWRPDFLSRAWQVGWRNVFGRVPAEYLWVCVQKRCKYAHIITCTRSILHDEGILNTWKNKYGFAWQWFDYAHIEEFGSLFLALLLILGKSGPFLAFLFPAKLCLSSVLYCSLGGNRDFSGWLHCKINLWVSEVLWMNKEGTQLHWTAPLWNSGECYIELKTGCNWVKH